MISETNNNGGYMFQRPFIGFSTRIYAYKTNQKSKCQELPLFYQKWEALPLY